MNYTDCLNNISPQQLQGFFVGWPDKPSPEKHLEILRNSAYIWLAVDEKTNKVVGFVNAVSDKTMSAYIPLLEVLPEFQSRGIGTELMNRMLNTLKNLYMIDLACDIDKMEFYEKLGLVRGNLMMKRNYDKQSCE